jgi:hypothetical protein
VCDRGELYDLEEDPYELENRIDDPVMADIKAQLLEMMGEHIDRLGDPIRNQFEMLRHVY